MKRSLSIILLFVFVTANVGFAVGTHYCGSHAVINKVVLGSEDLDCGMGMMMKSMQHSEEMARVKGCCENVFQDLKLKDNYKASDNAKSPELTFAVLFAITYADLFISSSERVVPFQIYNPPPLERDITVLFHSFLV